MMRLEGVTVALALLALSVSLVWPEIQRLAGVSFQGDSTSECPLGFQKANVDGSGGMTITPFSKMLKPTHVYSNGSIWTSDPEMPWAEAMSVDASSGRVVAVGTLQDVLAGAGTAAGAPGLATKRVDLGGRFVTPGFVDAHVHYITGGLMLRQLDLSGVVSRKEFVAAVREAAAGKRGHSPSTTAGWVLGYGWDESRITATTSGGLSDSGNGGDSSGGNGGDNNGEDINGGTARQQQQQLPSAGWIDEVTGDVPVLLTRMDGHMALANTAALKLAGVWPRAPDLGECGAVHADARGRPTGILTESCGINLVSSHVPSWSLQDRMAAAHDAADYALARGVTTVTDMGRFPWDSEGSQPWADLEHVYDALADQGKLRTRIHAMVPLPTWERLSRRVKRLGRRHRSGRLQWGALKEFADGSLGSRTALMHQPYTDDVSTSGKRVTPLQQLEEWAAQATRNDLQVAIHAIGDRAVDEVVATISRMPPAGVAAAAAAGAGGQKEGSAATPAHAAATEAAGTGGGGKRAGQKAPGTAAAPGNAAAAAVTEAAAGGGGGGRAGQQARQQGQRPCEELRHRVEHAQHLSGPGAGHAMALTGVHVVANPLHLPADVRTMADRLGPHRSGAGHSYALRSMLQAGVNVSFGSDWPVVHMDALGGAFVAVNRREPGARSSSAWALEERLTGEEALYAHTVWAAEASWMDDEVGSLKPGMRADFVILSGSPVMRGGTEHPPSVLSTYMDGLCEYGCTVGTL